MIGRIRNNLFWTIAVLFLAKFIAVVCTLDDALGIRDSWSEEIDGHRRYPEEYGELRACHATNLRRVSKAGSLHWRASVGRFRRRVLLLRSVSICTQVGSAVTRFGGVSDGLPQFVASEVPAQGVAPLPWLGPDSRSRLHDYARPPAARRPRLHPRRGCVARGRGCLASDPHFRESLVLSHVRRPTDCSNFISSGGGWHPIAQWSC